MQTQTTNTKYYELSQPDAEIEAVKRRILALDAEVKTFESEIDLQAGKLDSARLQLASAIARLNRLYLEDAKMYPTFIGID